MGLQVTDFETVVYDMDEATFQGDPVPGGSLSSSGARALLPPSCPARFRYDRDHPVYKDVFDFGSAAHKLALGAGPELALLAYEDWRTKAPTRQRATARSAGQGPTLK